MPIHEEMTFMTTNPQASKNSSLNQRETAGNTIPQSHVNAKIMSLRGNHEN